MALMMASTSWRMGDDWSGKFDHLRSLCQVLYLPRTTGISSTALKAGVKVGAAVSAV